MCLWSSLIQTRRRFRGRSCTALQLLRCSGRDSSTSSGPIPLRFSVFILREAISELWLLQGDLVYCKLVITVFMQKNTHLYMLGDIKPCLKSVFFPQHFHWSALKKHPHTHFYARVRVCFAPSHPSVVGVERPTVPQHMGSLFTPFKYISPVVSCDCYSPCHWEHLISLMVQVTPHHCPQPSFHWLWIRPMSSD